MRLVGLGNDSLVVINTEPIWSTITGWLPFSVVLVESIP